MANVFHFKKLGILDDYYSTNKCRNLPRHNNEPCSISLYMVVSTDKADGKEQYRIRIFCPVNPFPVNIMTVNSFCAVQRIRDILVNKGWSQIPFPSALTDYIHNL